ncbi:SapC family protein [Glaciecola sp. MH2013]|uniref:SapC family protein n=1 Tax=Glaciecola sp. MH2013 TaxID=2785524 RepID=UPI00189E9BD6|nr:SapC family protein [Glaciecola sp. MH2013]MBF7072439.1 SapC family protein [Glaciecola sp. MH2013]
MMNPTYVALSADLHKNKKVKEIANYAHAKDFHLASISVDEFGLASANYPIVFVRNDDKSISAVALMGLAPKQNLFIDSTFNWLVPYVPAIIRRYPFSFVKVSAESSDMALCVNDTNAVLNDSEGLNLFNSDGTPSSHLTKVQKFLSHMHNMQHHSQTLFELLDNEGLFTDKALEYQDKGETKSMGGFMVVDYEKLRSLSDEKYLKLRSIDSALECIHIHMGSLNQVQNLVHRANSLSQKDS